MQNQFKENQIFDSFLDNYIQMAAVSDIDQLIRLFVAGISETLRAERVSFMLMDQTGQELYIKASCGLGHLRDSKIGRMKLGEMFVGWVAQNGNPLLVKDVDAEFPDLPKERPSRYKTKSFIIVPVKIKQEVIGVLSLTDRRDSSVFTEDDLKKINFLCSYLALCIENIRLLEKNADLLITDTLTGLLNHRYFQERLNEEIYRAERYRRPLSLLLLDIDNFHCYNQNYGYSAGDSALKQISSIMRENTRQADTVSRYGPEEFMVILPETRLRQAVVVGERIREAVWHSIFTEDRSSSLGMARLTVSIGVVEFRIGLSREEIINRVSNALLQAKQKGRNCVCRY